ncbi:MAG: hypothetical protein PHH01_03110 [Patescibacteria group bacterium]|nr:hypothetical protein [Patescibacteria group bacterium]MDD5567162.1 hypothetical protein [Patescibacteria group bacterium]
MYEIKKISVIGSALMAGWISGCLSLISLVVSIIFYASFLIDSDAGWIIGFGIGLVVLGYIAGFIFGVLVAWLYNLWSDWVGGVKLEICQIAEAEKNKPAPNKTIK